MLEESAVALVVQTREGSGRGALFRVHMGVLCCPGRYKHDVARAGKRQRAVRFAS